jgi:hypothetical protein
MVDGKAEYSTTYTITFAQMIKNLKTPDGDGIRYLVPEFPYYGAFFSNNPELMEKQLRGRRCLIDP